MKTSVFYWPDPSEHPPAFKCITEVIEGKTRYLISFPPRYSEVTEYTADGVLYLIETAYSPANG
jgi:hypothetical protein